MKVFCRKAREKFEIGIHDSDQLGHARKAGGYALHDIENKAGEYRLTTTQRAMSADGGIAEAGQQLFKLPQV